MRADVRAQQIKQRRVGKEAVGAEAIALQKQEVKAGSRGFGFGYQAGFADPCFSAKQDDLALSPFGLLYQHAQSGEFRGSTDDLRAQERSIDRAFHRMHSLSFFAARMLAIRSQVADSRRSARTQCSN